MLVFINKEIISKHCSFVLALWETQKLSAAEAAEAAGAAAEDLKQAAVS